MTRDNNHNPESVVREIRRKTRKKYSSEEKIRIVPEGLKGEEKDIHIFPLTYTRKKSGTLPGF